MNKTLDKESLLAFKEDFENHQEYTLGQRSITHNGIVNSAIDDSIVRDSKPLFSLSVDSGLITNQKMSGRCWMFAGLNVLRGILLKKLNVDNIELSQPYLQFFDKLEKSNFYLERVLELKDEPFNSRYNVFNTEATFYDGGHWAFFTSLVKKYGVLPLSFMPETACSNNTRELNDTLKYVLTQDAYLLRKLASEGKTTEELYFAKEKMLNDVYRVLRMSLGTPVEEFTFEYQDKDKKFVRLEKMTPKDFYDKYIAEDLNDYISLNDSLLEGMEKGVCYTSHFVASVEGGDSVLFFNTDLEELKKSVIASLQGGDLVWFAGDVSSQSLRKEGILSNNVLRLDQLMAIPSILNKTDRLNYRASFCNHAMTFTGVNLIDNIPNRWKVENSWGKDNGDNGYFTMDDSWFDNYVYEVIVKKCYIDEKIVKQYEESRKSPVEIEPFNTLFLGME